jgi:hypothetical protein
MTKPENIGNNLRKKNNLSSLGLDGIGYLMMKVGQGPMLQFIANLFAACIEHSQVPQTWKRSRTVFLYKKGEVSEPSNWRPITITSCVYRVFMSIISEFIQQHIHKSGKRKIFSQSQKGFVMGIQGCMEHAVMTREIIAHSKRFKKNIFMVQIDFSNAFGSVPQKMIDWNMRRMGIPDNITNVVMNVYDGCETVLSLTSGVSNPIQWTSGTVQGCPLSPVLFNICLEPLLRALERPDYLELGFPIDIQVDGKPDEQIRVNTAAYADDLILYSDHGDGINRYLELLAKYCSYTGMKVNVKKCVSLAETYTNGNIDRIQERLYYSQYAGLDSYGNENWGEKEEIPLETSSLYLGTTIA